MAAEPPTGKVRRALVGGRTAAKAGGQVLTYYAKRPFLSKGSRPMAKKRAAQAGAQTLFEGLSLLRGTALKMAQQLSMEIDMLPDAACRELAKAYHQVPPINRALARKVVQEALGQPPERIFKHFDLNAFAAASLGQVHYAVDTQGDPLAVKIQYPGIAKTIDSDLGLLRHMLRPMMHTEQMMPALNEIADRLREEADYLKEAEHARFFAENLKLQGVHVPKVYKELTTPTVLTTTYLQGKPLDVWLQDHPDRERINHVAQKLNELVITGVYELNVIHADPNPGNFIIADDDTIGLVDFGCVKRLAPQFIDQYRHLALAAAHHEDEAHFEQIVAMGFLSPNLTGKAMEEVRTITHDAGRWFGRLYQNQFFDFAEHPDFIADGKAVMGQYHRLRRYLRFDPEFIFLDRTRYGLWRIFERMGAKVQFRNPYEW